jgi:seryl-tRNA synthetase
MIMVEDKAVESAMIDFMLELHDFEIGWSTANKIKISANELIKAVASQPKTERFNYEIHLTFCGNIMFAIQCDCPTESLAVFKL